MTWKTYWVRGAGNGTGTEEQTGLDTSWESIVDKGWTKTKRAPRSRGLSNCI